MVDRGLEVVRVDASALEFKERYGVDLMLIYGSPESLSDAFRGYGDASMANTSDRAYPGLTHRIKLADSLLGEPQSPTPESRDESTNIPSSINDISHMLPYPDAGYTAPGGLSSNEDKIKYLTNCHFATACTLLYKLEGAEDTGRQTFSGLPILGAPWGEFAAPPYATDYRSDYFFPEFGARTEFCNGFTDKDGFTISRLGINPLDAPEGFLFAYKGAGYMQSPLEVIASSFPDDLRDMTFGKKHGFDVTTMLHEAPEYPADPFEAVILDEEYLDGIVDTLTELVEGRTKGKLEVVSDLDRYIDRDPEKDKRVRPFEVTYRSARGTLHTSSISFDGVRTIVRAEGSYRLLPAVLEFKEGPPTYPAQVEMRISPTILIKPEVFTSPHEVARYFEEANCVTRGLRRALNVGPKS